MENLILKLPVNCLCSRAAFLRRKGSSALGPGRESVHQKERKESLLTTRDVLVMLGGMFINVLIFSI